MRNGWTRHDRDSITYVSQNGRHYFLDESISYGPQEIYTSGEILCFESITIPDATEEELIEIERNCGTRYTWRGNFVGWCAGGSESEEEIDDVCKYMENVIADYELNN